MPTMVCRQPNGLFAVFSTITDDFIITDATPAYLLDYLCQAMGRIDAIAKVQRGLDDEDLPPPFNFQEPGQADGLRRWHNALWTIRMVHGEQKAALRENQGREVRQTLPP